MAEWRAVAGQPHIAPAAAKEYYDQSLDRFAGWIQHQDSKAGLALVVLGIALSDLLDHANELADAHRLASTWGLLATVAFWVALGAGAATVLFAWLTVFPRLTPRKESPESVYFFGRVAQYESPDKYVAAVSDLDDEKLRKHLAYQVWELADHANRKAEWVRWAYVAVGLFLVCWGVARVALSLAA